MRALTVSQPFASLIASGMKFVENRRWSTSYRGPLAIHAGKGSVYLSSSELNDYPRGAIVAVAELVACLSIEQIDLQCQEASLVPGTIRTWMEIGNHVHTEGPFCWVLEDVRPTRLVEMRGAQGLWGVSDELVYGAVIDRALAHARLCWSCKNISSHADSILPWVRCPLCNSADTRRT